MNGGVRIGPSTVADGRGGFSIETMEVDRHDRGYRSTALEATLHVFGAASRGNIAHHQEGKP